MIKICKVCTHSIHADPYEGELTIDNKHYCYDCFEKVFNELQSGNIPHFKRYYPAFCTGFGTQIYTIDDETTFFASENIHRGGVLYKSKPDKYNKIFIHVKEHEKCETHFVIGFIYNMEYEKIPLPELYI